MGWSTLVVLGVVLAAGFLLRHRVGGGGVAMEAVQLLERLGADDCLVLDVRSLDEYRSGHVPTARHIPHTSLAGRLDELQAYRDREVVVYCERGVRARMAQNILTKAGFDRVYHLAGDMAGWRREGWAVETGG